MGMNWGQINDINFFVTILILNCDLSLNISLIYHHLKGL